MIKRRFTILLLCIVFSLQSIILPAQTKGSDPAYRFITSDNNFTASKNYYLLTLFQALPDVVKLLVGDAQLSSIARRKSDSLLQP